MGLIDKNVIYCISLVSNTLYDNISFNVSIYVLFIITPKTTKTFRGEEGEQIQGEDAAVTNGAATNGEKLYEGANPKAE